MKLWKKIFLGLLFVLVVIQFIQPRRNSSDRSRSAGFAAIYQVPGEIYDILKVSCYDCHSDNTKYPWYSRIQPFGWLMANHIRNGKAKLNFDGFDTLSTRMQIAKLKNIAGSIRDGSMPLRSYAQLNRKAKISNHKKTMVITWLDSIRTSISSKK